MGVRVPARAGVLRQRFKLMLGYVAAAVALKP